LIVAAVACVGCSPAARLHGQWEVDTAKLQNELSGGNGGPLAGLAAGFMSVADLEMEFNGDQTCSMTASILGRSKTASGSWRFIKTDGEALVIAVKQNESTDEREVRVRFIDNDHLEMASPMSMGDDAQSRTFPFVRVKPK
jgi:hypothetical protein